MSSPGGDGPFNITVDPRNDQYDPDDERWLDQVTSLRRELGRQVDLIRDGRPVAGTKGAADQLIIALGSAGAFQAAVTCFRGWLARDRDRRLDIRWEEDGVARSVTLTGQDVDAQTIRDIAKAAIGQRGGSPWPAGTEHS
jgi:Effector Associated Constant Component 1